MKLRTYRAEGTTFPDDAMSLRKSPNLTPALLAANRRNARKSTGPRTARGKRQSRLNALRSGGRSRLRGRFFAVMLSAPRGAVERWVREILTPEMAWQPLLREEAEILIEAERQTGEHFHQLYLRQEAIQRELLLNNQSRNTYENKPLPKMEERLCHDVIETV